MLTMKLHLSCESAPLEYQTEGDKPGKEKQRLRLYWLAVKLFLTTGECNKWSESCKMHL